MKTLNDYLIMNYRMEIVKVIKQQTIKQTGGDND